MKHSLLWAILALPLLVTTACLDDVDATSSCPQDTRSIVVIYDNDVHCAVDGYIKMAGYRDAVRAADTAWVATVSAGDYLQGGAIGALSNGQYIIDVMKEMEYDAVTLGNHEFDYKVPRMRQLMSQMPAGTVTCCNFYNGAHDSLYYREYVIKEMGPRKVAFVGVTTPGAMLTEAGAFLAEDGVTLLYDLREADCAQLVQGAVDKARAAGADYVILVAHLGEADRGQTSVYTPTLLAKTRGIDIVLDGHTHSTIPNMKFPNIDGDSVVNIQTGTKFEHIGKLIITGDGKITSELVAIKDITQSSEKIQRVVDATKAKVESKLQEVIGENLSPNTDILDEEGESRARYSCVPLGTLICESFRSMTGAQIGLFNGGGVRTSLPMGQITYGHLLDVLPFGNEVMTVMATGQQILDALESGVKMYPNLSGGFLQCAGMRYEFNPDNTPTLEFDPVTYVMTVTGTRRITKCEVLGDDGEYHLIDPAQKYKVASVNFVINEGKEIVAFRQSEILDEGICTDLDAFITYIRDGLHGVIPEDYGK